MVYNFTNINKTNKSPLNFTHWAQKRPQHMTLEIHVLAWDRYKEKFEDTKEVIRCRKSKNVAG
jgi:hypothetical protein